MAGHGPRGAAKHTRRQTARRARGKRPRRWRGAALALSFVLAAALALAGATVATATSTAVNWIGGAYGSSNVLSTSTATASKSTYLKLGKNTLTATTWGVSGGHVRTNSNGSWTYTLPYSSSATTYGGGTTSNYVLKLDFSGVATINGRKVAATLYVTKVSFGSLLHTSNSGYSTSETGFLYLNTSTLWSGASSDSTYYVRRGLTTVSMTVELTWADTGEALSDMGTFVVASDIDQVNSYRYGSTTEAVTFGSAFSEYYCYSTCELYTDGAGRFYNAYDNDQDGTDSYHIGGIYGVTESGTFKMTFENGNAQTQLKIYVPDSFTSLSKTVGASSYTVGDTVTWTVAFEMPEFYTETLTTYDTLVLTDTLPSQVAYDSLSVKSGSTTLTKGTHYSVSTSGQVVTVTFLSAFRDSISYYAGQKVTVTITTTATTAGTATNTAEVTTDGGVYTATATTKIYSPALSISKSVGASVYQTGDKMVWTVTVGAASGTYRCAAENVVIEDELPDGLVLTAAPTISTSGTVSGAVVASGAAGDGSWTVTADSMATGSTITVTFRTTAPAVSEETSYVNTAAAYADNVSELEATAATTVPAPGALSISKTVLNETAAAAARNASFAFKVRVDAAEGSYTAVFTAANGTVKTDTVAFSDGTAMVEVDSGGSVEIQGLPGLASYRVTELSSSMPDGYTATSLTGAVGEIASGETTEVVVVNTYAASGTAVVEAVKTMSVAGSAGTPAGLFSFQLTDGDGNVVATGANASDGSVALTALSYTEADDGKTYTYTLTEVDGGLSWYAYDDAVWTVVVAVADEDGQGALATTVTYYDEDGAEADGASFENRYEASGSLSLTAFKAMAAGDIADYDGAFAFTLTDDATGEVVSTVANDGAVVTFDELTFDEDDIGLTFTYTASEVAGDLSEVVYSTETITYTVTVVDGGEGVLEFDVTTSASPVFTNDLEDGSLVIAKSVSDGSDDGTDTLFTFYVQLVGTGLPGTYDVEYLTLAEALGGGN